MRVTSQLLQDNAFAFTDDPMTFSDLVDVK